MTTTKVPLTFEGAEAERDRLATAARAAGEIADALAAERWAVLDVRRKAWATAVLAESAAVGTALAKAEGVARRAFHVAAVTGDARSAFFEWLDARSRSNAQRDRVVAARSFLGEPQDERGYIFTDQPKYSVELDRALGAEASSRFADAQGEVQLELNKLDAAP